MKKVILVEPEIPENTGFIARLSANFGFDIRIVNPGFNLSECRDTANKAQNKLREAQIYETVQEAVSNLNYVVGTKPGRGERLENFDFRPDTSLMLGRESSGLSNDELAYCDAVIHIDTEGYSSINLSHAAAIFMDKMSGTEKDEKSISEGAKEQLEKVAGQKTAKTIISANPAPEELNRIIGELK